MCLLLRGKLTAQLEEKEGILFADVGECRSVAAVCERLTELTLLRSGTDTDVVNKARAGIPVSVLLSSACCVLPD